LPARAPGAAGARPLAGMREGEARFTRERGDRRGMRRR
jgi:hypothetical protein